MVRWILARQAGVGPAAEPLHRLHKPMTVQTHHRLDSALKTFSAVAGRAGVLAGCLVLAGWVFDIESLKRTLPHPYP